MSRIYLAVLTVFFYVLTSINAMAAGNISVSKTVGVDATAAIVWAKVKDFNALNTWHPAVAKDEILEGENTKPGAVRLLTLNDGGTINEELLRWHEGMIAFGDKIFESDLPVGDDDPPLTVEATA